MRKRPHSAVLCLLPLACFTPLAYGQAAPAAVGSPQYEGFQLPTTQGTLTYSLNFSERANVGYNGADQTTHSTTFGGDLAYLSGSATHPFSMVYAGGYLVGTSDQPSSLYQSLSLSQVLSYRKWNVIVSDSVSYLPQSPTAGLSGVPGVGDGGVAPVSGSNQSILTENSDRISNSVAGSVQRSVTGKTSLQAFGSESILTFVGDSGPGGLDSHQYTAGGGGSHRLNALSSVNTNVDYSSFRFGGSSAGFSSEALTFGYVRQFTRRFGVNASLGPQRTDGELLAHSVYGLSADVSANYSTREAALQASYTSGSSNGSGVSIGARTQSLVGSASRALGRAWNGSLSVSYSRSSNLPVLGQPAFTTNTGIVSTQIGRALGRHLSGFFSYTAERQDLAGVLLTSNSFSGLTQVFGFGISYVPASLHLGGR